MRRYVAVSILFVFALVLISAGVAQEQVDLQVITQIKSEGFEHSQVMETLSYLTDVYGPRLTGSPNLRKASEWARDRLAEWGLANARLEPWGTFGRGWAVESYSIEMIEPQYMVIVGHPKAWTPSTDGTVTGTPVLVEIESEEDFEKYEGTLSGAIVMTQEPPELQTKFEADARRRSKEDLEKVAQAPEPGARPSWWARRAEFRARMALQRKIVRFLREEGAALLLEPSSRNYGIVRVSRGGDFKLNSEPALPAMVIAAEQYNRLARLLEKGLPVTVRANVQNRFFEEDTLAYNVIAEIPGTDRRLKKELVMLGAHLDSWHAGTGATDNAAGSAVVMEAVRILKAIGVKPRRTIRIALWSGEEQGLLGSRNYVKEHFADRKTMELKPEHALLSAYFNLDNGSGKIRGVYLQGNDAVRPIFAAYLQPFHDLGATTLSIRNTGGTDHLSFDAVGLPGFQFIQDPLDYGTRTHHTNLDVYDHAIPSDLMQASVIMASFVYHTAMRKEKLPRKPLPEPQQPPQTAER